MDKKRLAVFVVSALLLAFSGMIYSYGTLLSTSLPQADLMTEAPVPLSDNFVEETAPEELALMHPSSLKPLPAELIDEETLWLARCIFSETKRPEEQILVAWVIRNRVETGYRGKRTYRDVVLDPYQFSAFINTPENYQRAFYTRLNVNSKTPGWQRALHIAHAVRAVDQTYRPFALTTRHFYSERSMQDLEHPEWVIGQDPVDLEMDYEVDERRFRFYRDIS